MMLTKYYNNDYSIIILPGLCCDASLIKAPLSEIYPQHNIIEFNYSHGLWYQESHERTLSLEDILNSLNLIIEQNSYKKICLVGWSLGFSIALEFIKQYGSDHIHKLVCIDQSPYLLVTDDWPYGAFSTLTPPIALNMQLQILQKYPSFTQIICSALPPKGKSYDEYFIQQLLCQANKVSHFQALALFIHGCTADYRDFVSRLNIPLLVLIGGKSRIFDTGIYNWYRHHLDFHRVLLFNNSGHMPFVDEQKKFTAELSAFILSED